MQYYTPWLVNRFRAGFVYVRNPLFPNKISKYDLRPGYVDAVLFCSKNYQPILPYIDEFTKHCNTYFHYTITAYGKDIEPGVPSIDESIETLKALSKAVGRERVAWRYDPVLLTDRYTAETHEFTFNYIAERVHQYIDRCIFNFVEMYRKLERNMPELVKISDEEKDRLAAMLGRAAAEHGIYIQTCGANGDYTRYGIQQSGCATLDIIGKANGVSFRNVKHKGMRNGCHCIESRDIGTYDTCPNGCRYCYANRRPEIAVKNYRNHDPDSPILCDTIKDSDIITESKAHTYLKAPDLFDDFLNL